MKKNNNFTQHDMHTQTHIHTYIQGSDHKNCTKDVFRICMLAYMHA
jgi:hypothetical protein